jgi:hypothetical protein
MNRSSDSILSVYSDARAEYTKQLCVFLVPAFFQFFTELLEKSKQTMINEPKRVLWQFQNYLNEIHDWNMEKVNNEIHIIQTNSGCDYLEDLLTAVFIAHTKVLTAIRLSSNNKKVEINVPKVEHFLFKVLCETSKLLWSSTYLFRDGISGIEKQQNYRNIEQLINEGIIQAVRSLVPVKSILRDFVGNDNGGGDDDDDDDDEPEEKKEEKQLNHDIPIPTEPVKLTEAQPNIIVPNDVPIEPLKNEIIEPPKELVVEVPSEQIIEKATAIEQTTQPQPPQTIIIDDKPSVTFGDFNAHFDSDNPDDSDMVYDSKEDDVPDLEILDDSGEPLSAGIDFDSLDNNEEEAERIGEEDYEELS